MLKEINITANNGDEINRVIDINIARGENVILLEKQGGTGTYKKDIKFNINVAENGFCYHYRINMDDDLSNTNNIVNVSLARDANYNMVAINGNCGVANAAFNVDINGAGAHADLSGMAVLKTKQKLQTVVLINHMAAHATSSQLFKHVLNDNARGDFQGKIYVALGAQKTNGYQLSRNLLLSNLAEMKVKPELEIYADDVKCSHGSTTGQLDDNALFYLLSRGIEIDTAKQLLIEAFLMEIVDKIKHEDIRDMVYGTIVNA